LHPFYEPFVPSEDEMTIFASKLVLKYLAALVALSCCLSYPMCGRYDAHRQPGQIQIAGGLHVF
jgi:hypothetical protein